MGTTGQPGPVGGSPARTRRAAATSALVAGVLIAISVLGNASAQDPVAAPNPSVPSPLLPEQAQGVADTQYTQVPKNQSSTWAQVGGQVYGKAVPAGSPTPKTTDFYAVDFRNGLDGYAAGADCTTPNVSDDQLGSCPTRVPVIYHYSDPDGVGGTWTKVDLPGGDEKGYVGALAFLGAGRVLAVGGDGAYPRRE